MNNTTPISTRVAAAQSSERDVRASKDLTRSCNVVRKQTQSRYASFLLLSMALGTQGCAADADSSQVEGDLCTGPCPVETATYAGSARLTPRLEVQRTVDGAEKRRFLNFYDNQLRAECKLIDLGNGTSSCLPKLLDSLLVSWRPPGGGGGEVASYREAFSDSTCQSPLSSSEGVVLIPAQACGEVATIRTTTTRLAVGAQTYWRDGRGACVPGDVVSGGAGPFLTVIANPGDYAQFVRSKETRTFPHNREGTAVGLVAQRYESADGAFVSAEPRLTNVQSGAIGHYDQTPRNDGSGLRPFIPARILSASNPSYFSDSTCSINERLFAAEVPACEADAGIGDILSYTVRGVDTYSRISAAATGNSLFTLEAGGCGQVASDAAKNIFSPSALVPFTANEVLGIAREVAPSAYLGKDGSRIRVVSPLRTSMDGMRMREQANLFFDSQFKTFCTPGLDFGPNGVNIKRCVPRAPRYEDVQPPTAYSLLKAVRLTSRNGLFADASCTTQVWAATGDYGMPASASASQLVSLMNSGYERGPGGGMLALRPAPIVGITQVFEKDSMNTCVAKPVPSGAEVYLGLPVAAPMTDFVEMSVEIEGPSNN